MMVHCPLGERMSSRRYWWVDRGVYGVLHGELVTLWRISFIGIPYKCVRFHAEGLRRQELLHLCERHAQKMLDKAAGRRVAGGVGEVVTDPEWSVLYPILFDHLTQVVWPDKTARLTSSLSIFSDGSMVKAVLKDREAGLCLWCAAKSFQELFGVIEALLADPAAEWRVDRLQPGQKATRVEK